MRRILHMFGGLILVAICASGVGVGIVIHRGNALDAESRAFVDSAVPAIAASWNTAQLFERAAPELRANVKPDQLRALFQTFSSRLGPLKQYEGATGDAVMTYDPGAGGSVRAAYVAHAKFEIGVAVIRVMLIKRGGQWQISGFRVDATPFGVGTVPV